MDFKQALADLTEISSQIRSAVILESDGAVTASTLDSDPAKEMAEAAAELLAAAERTRPGLGPGALTQLEVATLEGSVFVVRDHGRVIAATTSSEPTVGLVFYDLKSCLRNAVGGAAEQASKPKSKAAPRKSAAKEPQKAKAKPAAKDRVSKPKGGGARSDDAPA